MNITLKNPPAATPTHEPQGNSARERAISRLMSNAAPNTAPDASRSPMAGIGNANAVSPEDAVGIAATASQTPPEALAEGQQGVNEAADSQEAPKAPEPAAEESPLSSQYAQLAKRERALRAQAQKQQDAIKARESEIAAREAAIKAKEEEYATKYIPRERFKADPWAVMSEEGVSYDQVTERALSETAMDPATRSYLQKLEAKIAELETGSKGMKQTFEQQQRQAYEQAITQLTNEATKLVANDDAYETIRATGSIADVVELIEKTFEKEKVVLSVEEAAQAVEDYLVEEALKLSKLKKIQSRLAPKDPPTPVQKQPEPPKQQQPQQMKTLTHAVGTNRPLTARERAILAAEGKLNKN
jgi:hypothetical protein